jgi:hypothetical protein
MESDDEENYATDMSRKTDKTQGCHLHYQCFYFVSWIIRPVMKEIRNREED